MVGGLDDVEVVLDHDDGVAGIDQPVENTEQLRHVVEVQTGRRLVQDVERLAGRTLRELGRQLHALSLATGQRGRRLPELDVAETDVPERVHVPGDRWDRGEELARLRDAHLEHLGDVLALVANLEGLAVVALALADLARNVDVGQEVHLDLDRSVARARLATAAPDVEREAAGLITAPLASGVLAKSLRM